MSTGPFLRVLSLTAVLGGGIAIGSLSDAAGRCGSGRPGREWPGTGGNSNRRERRRASCPVLPGKAFSGSLADLLRIAREAGDHNRAQAKMMMALDDASAADMQRLTAFFPGRLQMTIYPERGG